MKNGVIKGSFILLLSMLITKFIGAIYRIPLSNILKTEGIGLYQMVFPIYSFLLIFVTSGISIATSKKIATYRAENDFASINKTLNIGICISFILGFIFSLLIFLSRGIISELQGNSDAQLGYVAISIGFIFSAIISVFRGYFQGYENMLPTAISQIIEQIVKLIFGLLFASWLMKYSIVTAVFGALLGVSLGEIISFIFLLIWFLVDKKKHDIKFFKARYNSLFFKDYISTALPISVNNIIMPLSNTVDSLIIVNLLVVAGFSNTFGTQLYGIYSGMVMPIVNLPIVLVATLSVALLPKISFDIKKGDVNNSLISDVIKYVWIFILPCTLGMVLLSKNIFSILYPSIDANFLNIASNLFIALAISIIFVSLSSIFTCVLQAYGHYKYPLFTMLIGSIIKIIFTIVLLLIPNINILGVAISQSFAYGIVCVLNLYKIQKHNLYKINAKEIILPIFISLCMGLIVYLILNYLTMYSILINSLLAVILGSAIYIILIFLFKIIKLEQIKSIFKS